MIFNKKITSKKQKKTWEINRNIIYEWGYWLESHNREIVIEPSTGFNQHLEIPINEHKWWLFQKFAQGHQLSAPIGKVHHHHHHRHHHHHHNGSGELV